MKRLTGFKNKQNKSRPSGIGCIFHGSLPSSTTACPPSLGIRNMAQYATEYRSKDVTVTKGSMEKKKEAGTKHRTLIWVSKWSYSLMYPCSMIQSWKVKRTQPLLNWNRLQFNWHLGARIHPNYAHSSASFQVIPAVIPVNRLITNCMTPYLGPL